MAHGDFLKLNFFGDIIDQIVNGNAFLQHRIAVSDGNTVVGFAVEIVGDAERRSDFILATVSFSNRAGFVVIDHKMFG